MQRNSETEKLARDTQRKDQNEAKKILDDGYKRAGEAYNEAKKQAEIVYKEARKIAADKQTQKEVEKVYKEALEQAKKLRDTIIAEAMVVFRSSYDQAGKS